MVEAQMIFITISEPKLLEGQKKKTEWRSTSESGWSQGFGIWRGRFQSKTKNVRNASLFLVMCKDGYGRWWSVTLKEISRVTIQILFW